MSELTLYRKQFYDTATVGVLYIDGRPFCHTLEPTTRNITCARDKIAGKTAIPLGCYKYITTYSPTFHRLLPLLLDVPYFDGIRIHSGNSAEDTKGCVIVGRLREQKDYLYESRVTLAMLLSNITPSGTIRIIKAS